MVTEGSGTEISGRPKSGKKQDFLVVVTDLLTLWDAVVCALLGVVVLAFQRRHAPAQTIELWTSGPISLDILVASLIVAFMLRDPDSVDPKRIAPISVSILRALRCCLFASGLLIAVGMLRRPPQQLDRFWLAAWMAIFAAAAAAARGVLGLYVHHLLQAGALREAVAVIGSRDRRDRLAAQIEAEADIVGVYDTPSVDEPEREGEDEIAMLLELGRCGGVDSVVLAIESGREQEIPALVERLKALPVQVAMCTDAAGPEAASPDLRILGGVQMAILADRPIKRHDLLVKTVIDKAVAVLVLTLLAPLMMAIAIAISATSPGPIIFRQTRQGWCGRGFVIFKFRSMYVVPEGCVPCRQTQRDDQRCTRVGRVLRRTSLDELPQLWNVLLGDMSLVGPRPHVDSLHDIDRAGRQIVAEYAQRNRVKPGITGWAQIHGARGATATLAQLQRRVAYDLYYIENWSLALDMRILARTPFCLMGEDAF